MPITRFAYPIDVTVVWSIYLIYLLNSNTVTKDATSFLLTSSSVYRYTPHVRTIRQSDREGVTPRLTHTYNQMAVVL